MTSNKQITANQQNALKSTGPQTDKGKSIVSQNALKHGILSKEVFIDEGMKNDFFKLKESFYLQFEPQGQLEHFLLDRVISSAWRLALLIRIEAQIYEKKDTCSFERDLEIKRAFLSNTRNGLVLLNRYEGNIERNLYRALGELKAVQLERKTNNSSIETIVLENGFVSQNGGI